MSMQGEIRQSASRGSMPLGVRLAVLAAEGLICLGALYLISVRGEALLLDLGALVYELHRQGQRAPELLQEKAIELGKVDREVRQLEEQLGR